MGFKSTIQTYAENERVAGNIYAETEGLKFAVKLADEIDDDWVTIPKPAAADNGKILKVVNGAYSKEAETVELPTSPTEAGTYTLKCTVADGVATLSWVADSE